MLIGTKIAKGIVKLCQIATKMTSEGAAVDTLHAAHVSMLWYEAAKLTQADNACMTWMMVH